MGVMVTMVMRTTMTRSCVARLLYTPAATLVSAPTRHSVIRGGPPTETSRAIICLSTLCQTVFLLSANLYFSALLNCISPLCKTVLIRCAQTYLSCAQFPNYCLINKKEQ